MKIGKKGRENRKGKKIFHISCLLVLFHAKDGEKQEKCGKNLRPNVEKDVNGKHADQDCDKGGCQVIFFANQKAKPVKGKECEQANKSHQYRDTAFSKEMPYIPKNNSRQPLLHDEMEIFVEGKRVCVWKSMFHDIAAVI